METSLSPPQNPLHERYASREMAHLFSARHRFGEWRRIWITLAECQAELGLPIRSQQLEVLRRVAPQIDLDRVAEIERQTRHDVVSHLRHFAEQAEKATEEIADDETAEARMLAERAGGILHLGATSAFVTDNTDALICRDALHLLEGRLVAAIRALADFARRHRDLPALAYTHFQPAQLTTVGKRACLWTQDLLEDLEEVRHRLATLRCRGVNGTTGTQASFLTLFDGDHDKVRKLDRMLAERLGFEASWSLTGQTYPRKQDTRTLQTIACIGESCHKFGTDLRLLQGVGELAEPFDRDQVGSSAMAYKKNPVRAERMCALARRLITDSLNGPLNTATQWLERSLDDSANRRLVLSDAFLGADAVLSLAGHIAGGLTTIVPRIASRVASELPFMATETFLMMAALKGGDRQELHERIRRYSFAAQEAVAAGQDNPLVDSIVADPDFGLSTEEAEQALDPLAFTGRSSQQVDEFLSERVEPALDGAASVEIDAPRI